jgi:hypothetical protein
MNVINKRLTQLLTPLASSLQRPETSRDILEGMRASQRSSTQESGALVLLR